MVKLILSTGKFKYFPLTGTGSIVGVELISGTPDFVQVTVNDVSNTAVTFDLNYESLSLFDDEYSQNKL